MNISCRSRKDKHGYARMLVSGAFLFFILSCASYLPEEIYLSQSDISGGNRFVLTTSSTGLDVKYHRDNPPNFAVAAMFGLLGGVIVEENREQKDNELREDTENISKGVNLRTQLAEYFTEEMRNANSQLTVDYFDVTGQVSSQDIIQKGYDAIIELDLTELSLRKISGEEKARIYAEVWGKMTQLQNKKLVWKKREVALSAEDISVRPFTEGDKEKLMRMIEETMRETTSALAKDIVFFHE